MTGSLRGSMAIVGIGEAGVGIAPAGATPLDLIGLAAAAALEDSGIALGEVDGLFTASAYYPMGCLDVAEYLGIRPSYADGTNLGGSSFVSHLLHAAAAISAGLCTTALIVYGSTQKSDGGRLVSVAQPTPFEAPHRLRDPISSYALAASRHFHQFGTTHEQLAEIAVAARKWARLTPGAFAQQDLSINDVLNSRVISSPLTVLDCCLVTDGAAAVVVTSAERARSAAGRPVYFLGGGESQSHWGISSMPDLTTTAAVESGRRAYAMARLRPSDIDVAQLYDAFTINTLLFLEDLGFCEKGEGGPFVADGGIAPGGRLPVNTNGGGLSYCHPGMNGLFHITEAVRQLRGGLGSRQVHNAEVALVHGNGGVLSSQVTVLLGQPSTVSGVTR